MVFLGIGLLIYPGTGFGLYLGFVDNLSCGFVIYFAIGRNFAIVGRNLAFVSHMIGSDHGTEIVGGRGHN